MDVGGVPLQVAKGKVEGTTQRVSIDMILRFLFYFYK
jgi:hypothetical protein